MGSGYPAQARAGHHGAHVAAVPSLRRRRGAQPVGRVALARRNESSHGAVTERIPSAVVVLHRTAGCRCGQWGTPVVALLVHGRTCSVVIPSCRQPFFGSKYQRFVDVFARATGLACWKAEHSEWVLRYRSPWRARRSVAHPEPILAVQWNAVWYLARDFAKLYPSVRCAICGKRYSLTTAGGWRVVEGRESCGAARCGRIIVRDHERMLRKLYRQQQRLQNLRSVLAKARKAVRSGKVPEGLF